MDRDDLLTALARVQALAKQIAETVGDTIGRVDEDRARRAQLAVDGCKRLEEAVALFTDAMKIEE